MRSAAMSSWARERLPQQDHVLPVLLLRRSISLTASPRTTRAGGHVPQGASLSVLEKTSLGSSFRRSAMISVSVVARRPVVHEQLVGPSSQQDRVDALEERELVPVGEPVHLALREKSNVPSLSTA
jgi:hypothetical protein